VTQGVHSHGRYFAALVALALAYWAAAWIGLQHSVVPGAGTALWPAAGIAFAGLVMGGLRLWPAIVIGRLLTALSVGAPQPLWALVLISVGTMLGGLVPAWLLLRWRLFDPALSHMRDIAALVFGAALVGAVVSASVGAATLLLVGTALPQLPGIWLSWSTGFFVGVVVAAPLILAWWPGHGPRLTTRGLLHLAAALAAVSFVSWLVFVYSDPTFLRVWHILPLFVWVALAFQVRGVALALAITSVFAIVGAGDGSGPLAIVPLTPSQQLLLTQQFIAVSGITMLVLGAAVDELRDKETQARLAAIVSSSPDAMLSCAPDGSIQSWNAGAERLFGYSAAEAIGRPVTFFQPEAPPEGRGTLFARALAGEVVEAESRRVDKDGNMIDVAITASQMRARDGTVLGVAGVVRDITERRKAEDYQRLLINELNHRVKNSLAIVQAIAQQSFGGDRARPEARAAFEGRLRALSAAHDLLTRENWESAGMRQIVEDALAPYSGGDGEGSAPRFAISGPDLRLEPKSAVSLALALHELATNAAKYGALSQPTGRIAIEWSDGDGRLRFAWREEGGPPVVVPRRRGFGTRLIERSLAAEFEGEVAIAYPPEGLVCTMDAPLPVEPSR
jgi:PAS domain S-box-containing protein